MGQSFRIPVLLFTCITSGFLYWTANIGILLTGDCWKVHDVWLNQSSFISPFEAFFILFVTLFLWLIAESIIARRKRLKSVFRNSILIGILVFLNSVFYVQYEHWQLLRFSQEIITFEKYWENRKTKIQPPTREVKIPNIQSFYEYKYETRCEAGLSPFNLTEQEKTLLYKSYTEKYYKKKE